MVDQTLSRKKPLSPRGAAVASLVGTTIEYYDFNVYATSVVVVLGPLFFPASDPLVSSLLALSTIGAGFFARPIGGIVFAHFGDRFGRKHTLIWSLVLMAIATMLVGLLPTYAAIGVWAPILLVTLRFVQGLATGGEWGGAVLLAVEHAPRHKRWFYGSFPQYGPSLGILSSAAVIALFQLMPEAAFQSWGWRVPFLLSIVLLLMGLYLRLRIDESTQFVAAQREQAVVRVPIAAVLRNYMPAVLIGAGVCLVANAGYIIGSFLPSFMVSSKHLPGSSATTALMIASVLCVMAIAIVSRRLDRGDLPRFTIASGVLVAIWAFPAFIVSNALGTVGLILAVSVNFVILSGAMAAMPGMIARLFPANVRYTGISTAYQLAAIVGGGLMPILVSFLVKETGGAFWPAAAMMAFAAVVTVVCSIAARRLPMVYDQVGGDEPTGERSNAASGPETDTAMQAPVAGVGSAAAEQPNSSRR